MKKLLFVIFLLVSTATFAQIKVLKVIGQPGISKADSVNGYVTPTQLKSKINYTDSASMLSPYLRKVDTTGKWISPAVANATYATISNLNLKANDAQVWHLDGRDTLNASIFTKYQSILNQTYTGTGYTYNKMQNAGGQFYIGQESSVAGGFFTGSSAYANVFYTSQPIQFLLGGKKFEISQTGTSLSYANNSIGDFVTRNVTTGLLSYRTASQTATDIGAATDANVVHLAPAGNEVANNKWARNSYVAMGGESIDLGMTGMYDRNELTNANLRGTVTDTLTSGGVKTTGYDPTLLFDGSAGFFNAPAVNGSNDSLVVNIDLGANVSNYSHAAWQPFVSYRLAADYYKNISVWVSSDNSTWYQPSSGWSWDYATSGFFPAACWMGTESYPGISTWRYARFTFKNPNAADNYVFISEIGIRHVSAPYARQYMLKGGDNIYGTLNLMNKSTNTGSINPSTGTFTGIFSGNSSSATKLQTARNINGVPFDGTSNITVTDATKEPTITAGTTSQFWRGDKTWQSFSTLPVSTATQTALNGKLDTSYRDVWTTIDPQVSDTVNKTIGLRQSFVDSLRNASFTASVFGLTKDGNNPIFNQDVVLALPRRLWFAINGNFYENSIGSFSGHNGIYVNTGNRQNIVVTPTGTSIDGVDSATAKLEIAASSGAVGDASFKIDAGKLTTVPENGAIERDSASERLFDTHLGIRDKITYESDLKNYLTKDSIGNRDYANDSTAVADGHLGLYDFYRTGNIIKVVTAIPNFVMTYVVDYSSGTNDSTQFQLQFRNGTDNGGVYPSMSVDWGDGNTDNFANTQTHDPTHKYSANGVYTVRISLGVNGGNLVDVFLLNNYPYTTKVTKVTNLQYLTEATDIELSQLQALDSTTYDFAYPSTLKDLVINYAGLSTFNITHTLPVGLINLRLDHNNFTSTEVNNILIWLDSQTFNAGAKSLRLDQFGAAPPSGAGLTAKSSLEAKGWTITTD